MSLKAYIKIEIQVGKTREVVKALHELEGVACVDSVTGSYDAIVIIEAETLMEIGDLVSAKLNSINGISRAATCLRMEAS